MQRHVLDWVRDDLVEHVARVSRWFWRELHASWHTQRARQRAWRRARHHVLPVPAHFDHPPAFKRKLQDFLALAPRVLTQTLEQYVGALDSCFTRWMLFRYWSHDIWGDVPLPPPARTLMVAWSTRAKRLALSMNMLHDDSLLEWWGFGQYWRLIDREGEEGQEGKESHLFVAACARHLTAEQRAFSEAALAFVQF